MSEDHNAEIARRVGKQALLKVRPAIGAAKTAEFLFVPVKIVSGQSRFGRIQFSVTPVGGRGTQTVEPVRLEFKD